MSEVAIILFIYLFAKVVLDVLQIYTIKNAMIDTQSMQLLDISIDDDKKSRQYNISKLNLSIMKNKINLISGDGIKKIQPNEYITINSQKKSLYAKKDIKKNETFKKSNIAIKGPAGGLLPKYMSIIINKKAKTKILKDEPITWDLL